MKMYFIPLPSGNSQPCEQRLDLLGRIDMEWCVCCDGRDLDV
eukprot:COSAG01_NODE_34139_length_552_cov_4.037528_2_plen_41_part_01